MFITATFKAEPKEKGVKNLLANHIAHKNVSLYTYVPFPIDMQLHLH